MNFSDWLTYQARRDDSVGDLARDSAQDPHWPKRSNSRPYIRRYLQDKGVTWDMVYNKVLDQAYVEWRLYQPERESATSRVKSCQECGGAGRFIQCGTSTRYICGRCYGQGAYIVPGPKIRLLDEHPVRPA